MRQRHGGFTLIELLVVIAIIAILAAILFPIFATAKKTAKKAGCASNLKQIAYAYRMYLDDYNDTYPSNNCGAHLFLVEPYMRSRKYKHGSATWANSVWLCPSAGKDMYYNVQPYYWSLMDPPVTTPWGNTDQVQVFVSYVQNAHIVRAGSIPQKSSACPQSSKYVFFAEACYNPKRTTWAGTAPTEMRSSDVPTVTGWYPDNERSYMQKWHDTGGNFLWADGHVTFLREVPSYEHIYMPYSW